MLSKEYLNSIGVYLSRMQQVDEEPKFIAEMLLHIQDLDQLCDNYKKQITKQDQDISNLKSQVMGLTEDLIGRDDLIVKQAEVKREDDSKKEEPYYWEYKETSLASVRNVYLSLKEIGEEGWELVCVTNSSMAYFKRPVLK